MMYALSFFDPTASATAYGQRPKFSMAEPSATAEGENCAYGPTLDFFNEFFLVSQVDKMFTSFLTLEMT